MIVHSIKTVAAAVFLTIFAAASAAAQSASPTYDAAGNLRVPEGYQTWVFAGSDLGLAYKDELPVITKRESDRAQVQMFHDIYIDPSAYAAFVKTGEFPDPTLLVMELYLAETKDAGGILKEGFFNGSRQTVEVAVKDSKRPTRPGSVENWAYYVFPLDGAGNPAPSAQAALDSECYACHKAHASHDNVWVQFYPALRDARKSGP
jgi:hypothetical protein